MDNRRLIDSQLVLVSGERRVSAHTQFFHRNPPSGSSEPDVFMTNGKPSLALHQGTQVIGAEILTDPAGQNA